MDDAHGLLAFFLIKEAAIEFEQWVLFGVEELGDVGFQETIFVHVLNALNLEFFDFLFILVDLNLALSQLLL